MKIYIDEDLPESCSKCRFLVHCDACEGHENYCPLIGSSIGYDLADDLADCVSVTPTWERHEDCPLEQRPHGEWLFVQRGKFVDLVCPFCKEVSIDDLAYNITAEEAKKRFYNGEYTINGKTELPYFCKNCGSDNRKRGDVE